MNDMAMITFFDVVTVACFVGLVVWFFVWTDQEIRTLMNFLVSGVAFAVANQVGNAGSNVLASILVVAGLGYAFLTARTGRA